MRFTNVRPAPLWAEGEYPFLPPDSEAAKHIKAEQQRLAVIRQNAGPMTIEYVEGERDDR